MTPTLLFGTLILTVGAPGLKDKVPKDPPIVGRWQATDLNVNGQPDNQFRGMEYEFTPKGEWVIYRDGKVIDQTARTYRLNQEAGPRAVDVSEGPAPHLGIFLVDGDVLKLSFTVLDNQGRPAKADETGPGLMTLTFTRVKKN
jgi:uncharacterized protein (TIGR03067 family)